MTYNPYVREYAQSLLSSGKRLFAVVPRDDANLPQVVKRLRVLNPSNTVVEVRVRTTGGDILSLPFMPGTTFEDGQFIAVYRTGTANGVMIHGYSDGGDPIIETIDDGLPVNLDFSVEDNSAYLGIL